MTTPTLLVTVNVHGLGPEAAAAGGGPVFGRLAHGGYAYHQGLARLLDVLREEAAPATFFWPAVEAARLPALLERCLAEGHEVACHGRAFEDHAALDAEAERAALTEARDALAARCGGAAPLGFRAPTGTLSARTLPLLCELGFRYDASALDDDRPYAADGAPGLLALPWSAGLSDATHFRRRLTQDRAEAFLREELDAVLPVCGYGCLTLHPRADIGLAREARVPVLRRLLDRARRHHGAAIRRCRDLLEDDAP